MRRIHLAEQSIDLPHLLELAQAGPVLLLAPDGQAYVVSQADHVVQEISELRQRVAFQHFLDLRSGKGKPRRSLAELAQEVDAAIAEHDPPE